MEATMGETIAAYGADKADESLLVKFFKIPQENKEKSEKEGRPIFEEIDFIEIRIPGNKDNIQIHKAKERDKKRFPVHWEKYQARTSNDEVIEGTLLEEWPGVTRSQAEELKFYHIRTVEQLASLTDVNAQNMRGAVALKQKAEKYLKNAMSNEELAKQSKETQAQLAKLIATAELAAPIPATPRKRGRPKKE